MGLLGKNGTGKTTTINILSGYLKPRSGECRIFGDGHELVLHMTFDEQSDIAAQSRCHGLYLLSEDATFSRTDE